MCCRASAHAQAQHKRCPADAHLLFWQLIQASQDEAWCYMGMLISAGARKRTCAHYTQTFNPAGACCAGAMLELILYFQPTRLQ